MPFEQEREKRKPKKSGAQTAEKSTTQKHKRRISYVQTVVNKYAKRVSKRFKCQQSF